MNQSGSRVLYVLYRYPQLSQTFVRDEIFALRRAGVEVEVLSLDEPESPCPPDTWAGPHRVVPRPRLARAAIDLVWWLAHRPHAVARLFAITVLERRRARFLIMRLPTLARELVAGDYKHVHTHFAWDTASVVSALSYLLGGTSSITLHARDIYAQPPQTVRRRLRRYGTIVTVCHFNVGYLRGARILRGIRAPITVIPCAVDVPATTDPKKTADVVAVGRLVEKKGLDVLIRAVGLLHAEFGGLRVIIVGDGPLGSYLRALVSDLDLDDSVTLVGALPHAETLKVIGSGRVFCMPANPAADGDSDAMPVVIREAMARGIPVVATDVAGIPESVQADVGWTVPAGSEQMLATALRSALSDTAEAAERGARARERCSRLWSFADQAASLMGVFASSKRQGPAPPSHEHAMPYR